MLGAVAAARADLVVPANAQFDLAAGVMDLACTDVLVAGTLLVGSGQLLNVRNVVVQPGGGIDNGSGLISLGGDWTNGGSFTGGTGSVRFRDACGDGSSAIGGSTTFRNASFVTATGKNYVFAVGSTQTIQGTLEIAGTAPLPIQFRSGTPAQVASINLAPAGVQQIQHVGVTDVWATGQWLAPLLSNEGGGGNAFRWFGQPVSQHIPVPVDSGVALALLAMLLALAGGRASRGRNPLRRPARRRATGHQEGPHR